MGGNSVRRTRMARDPARAGANTKRAGQLKCTLRTDIAS